MSVGRRTALLAPLSLAQPAALLQQPVPPFNVLIVTATAGYRHDSIPIAVDAIQRIGRESGTFATTVIPETADLGSLTPELLAQQHAVCFISTSGELPLSDVQKQALLDFVRGGGGFFGAHSATDTLYEWPEYGDLIGAYFREHPWSQPVRVTVEDLSHPATQALPASFEIADEIYVFRNDVRARPATRVLMSLDVSSVDSTVPAAGAPNDFPLAWSSTYGAGRVLYNALGHADAVWQDPLFTTHLAAALSWIAGR
ncbi:MAG TPA: ThuA domain-containing protein [Chloroflexota bacterium]|nr:ThuA domain-containing protein [Chloroflexota bacterium]